MIDPETGQEVISTRPSRLGIALRRYAAWIVLAAVVLTFVAYVVSAAQSTVYTAVGDVFVNEPTGTVATSDIQTQAQLIGSDAVVGPVARGYNMSLSQLDGDIVVTPEANANFVTVAARAHTPARAKNLVDQIYASYKLVSQTLPPSLRRTTSLPAVAYPDQVTSPRPLRDAGVGLLLGLLLAIGFAWLQEIRRPTAADAQLVVDQLGVPLFAEIGSRSLRPGRSRDRSFAALSLDLDELAPKGTRVLCLAGVRPGDLSLDLPYGLATAFADGGWRVVLVDGDPQSRLSSQLAATGKPGLSDLVGSPNEPMDFLVDGLANNVRLLPYGSRGLDRAQPNLRAELQRVFDALTEDADLVLLMVPDVGEDTESRLLASTSQGLVLVVRESTPLARIELARERLTLFQAPLIGFVRDEPPRSRRGLRLRGDSPNVATDPGLGADEQTARRLPSSAKSSRDGGRAEPDDVAAMDEVEEIDAIPTMDEDPYGPVIGFGERASGPFPR